MKRIKSFEEKIRSWLIARFTADVQNEIFERDNWRCILCFSNLLLDCHHVLFWLQVQKNSIRNTKKGWVCVCRACHNEIHGTREFYWKRQACIDYLDNLYE